MDIRPDNQFDPFDPNTIARFQEEHGPEVPDLDDINWDDPASFLPGLMPGGVMPKVLTAEQARKEARARVHRIYETHDRLHLILDGHEATIQKRWAKKTKPQRLKILLSAWPNMAPNHRPDFEAFRRASERGDKASLSGPQYRDFFLWPYINQEDLSGPKSLPLLLNARGRNVPSAFAAADALSQKFGMVISAIVPIFLNCHTMFLNCIDELDWPGDYGVIRSWDDFDADWKVIAKQFLPGEGLLILEAQERLYEFLVAVCEEILHEIPQDALTDPKLYPSLPPPQLKSETEVTGFESLAVMSAEAPYRLPAKLDLTRIRSLLEARRAAAEDHLWTMREDPAYFNEQLLEVRDHRPELCKDLHGALHPSASKTPFREGDLPARVISTALRRAYIELEVFADLEQQATELVILQAKYASVISPTKDLPDDYQEALIRFRFYLTQAVKTIILDNLRLAAAASPPLRHLYVRLPGDSIDMKPKPGLKLSKVEYLLTWLLQTLWEDGKPLLFLSLPMAVDELERLLGKEPEAHKMISAYVAGLIGDLSIVTQCLKEIELYQPWAKSFDSKWVDLKKPTENEYLRRTEVWAKINDAFFEKTLIRTGVAKLGEMDTTGTGRFRYPIEKRRTKENVEMLRAAEAQLDAFWEGVDKLTLARTGNLQGTHVSLLLSAGKILQRTPEWVEPADTAGGNQKKKGGQTAVQNDVDSLVKPFSDIYFGLSSPSSSGSTATTREKVKTRGTANPNASDALTQAARDETEDEQKQTVKVDARSLKVFRTLFFNPNITSSPAEIPWTDFLHAMTSGSGGLFAAEKLYGSVWQFRPTSPDLDVVQRPIQFHEPHPGKKMRFVVARRFGRRLFRNYGWTGDMFVLDK